MAVSWFIAKRYLMAQRRSGFLSFITLIAILGVMLGTASLIITLCVLDGFEREIKEKVVSFTSHIQVVGFQNKPLADYPRTISLLQRDVPGIRDVAPFASREGMIRSRDAVDGIFLKGIQPRAAPESSRPHMLKGRFLPDSSTGGQPPIVIGRRLADRLNADLGDKLVVFALPREGDLSSRPRVMQFELVGIYESGMAEFDDLYAYTLLSDAQRLFQLGDDVTGYDITVKDILQVDTVASRVQALLEYPHYARTVFQLYRNLFSWVELQKKLSPILLSLIIIVATVNIIGTILMFVLEKTKAIGMLKSLGAGPGLIARIFRLQGLLIASLGIGLGNGLAYVCCWLQSTFRILSLPSDIYYMDTVPMLIRPENFLLVTVLAFLMSYLTTVLPSRAAARLDPVAALRFG